MKNIHLNIPESGNGTPDILSEIRWNLDWMLTMQDEDGGVWHKQSSEYFPGFIMPEKDKSTSYVIGIGRAPYKSSCATADFAAVMAIAARVYQPFDAEYSQRALHAAERAWSWLDKYPDVTFGNPAGVVTGGYGDRNGYGYGYGQSPGARVKKTEILMIPQNDDSADEERRVESDA